MWQEIWPKYKTVGKLTHHSCQMESCIEPLNRMAL